MNILSVDLGGTNIKTAVVNDSHQILSGIDKATQSQRPPEDVADDIIACMEEAVAAASMSMDDIAAIGVGCPGTVDSRRGLVVYANNLNWHNFALGDYLAARTSKQVFIENDANVAALGEVAAGCAKAARDAVIITLGTGVGSGVVLGGRLFTGSGGGAAEIGHMVIRDGGEPCTCGRHGCLEAYASATALIRQTERAISENPSSEMAQLARQNGEVNGRTAFDAMRAGDEAAKDVVDQYINYLACGVANIINILQPEIIAFSGGISKEGEVLLAPMRKLVQQQIYGGESAVMPRLKKCTLGHRAGIIGSAEYARQMLTD